MSRTPQPLHIFRKDILHLWPEALVVVALFAAFAWAAPSGWTNSQYAGVATLVSLLLDVLMPISWLVLISRLVHDEPLVGDRQFWTSRPYHWAKLLAAKLLFLLVFIYVPFFVMQVFLLKHAGLYPTLALPALFHNLLLLTVVIIVPITALAAVTSTFARLLLSVIGTAIYLVIVALFIAWIVWEKMTPPVLNPILIGLLILLPAIALVYQYATRRTVVSRIMLAATPLLMVLLTFLTPFNALIRSGYPASTNASDPKLSDFPEAFRPKAPSPGPLATFRNEATVQIPFSVSGVDKDSAFIIKGVAATITAPGVTWTSPFVSAGQGRQITAGAPISAVAIPIPLSVFDKIGSQPADVHLTLATDHLKLDPAVTWKANARPFHIPSHGICSFTEDDPRADLNCRYALKAPQVTFITTSVTPGGCASGLAQPTPAQASIASPNNSLSFDPVITVPVKFQTADPEARHRYALCPGTPLSFLQAQDSGKVRFEVDVKQLILENYAAHHAPQQTAPNE